MIIYWFPGRENKRKPHSRF